MIRCPGSESRLCDLLLGKFSLHSKVCRPLSVPSCNINNSCLSLSWGLWKHPPGRGFSNFLTPKSRCQKDFSSQRSPRNKQRKWIVTELNVQERVRCTDPLYPQPSASLHLSPSYPTTRKSLLQGGQILNQWNDYHAISWMSVLVKFFLWLSFLWFRIFLTMHQSLPGFGKISVTLTRGALGRPWLA